MTEPRKNWEVVGWEYMDEKHCICCAQIDGMTQEGMLDHDGNKPRPIYAGSDDWQGERCFDCESLLG